MLPGKKITAAEVFQILRRRIWLLTIPPAVSLFAALIYSSTIPDVYQSDMLIAIDPQRVPDAFVRSTVTLDAELRLSAITVQVLSRTALKDLIETFDLYPEARKTRSIDDVVSTMHANLNIEMDRPRPQRGRLLIPSAFHVQFTYSDPQLAAKVTQQIGLMFVEQNARDRGALAGATNNFLQTQLEESRRRLEEQEHKLEAFRNRHGAELPSQMQSNMQGQLSVQMQVQSLVESLARDRDRRQLAQRLYREALADPPVSVPPVTTTVAGGAPTEAQVTVVGNARQQLASTQATLTSLERRYTPSHPDIVRLRRLIAELEPRAAAEAAAEAVEPGTATESTPAVAGDAQHRERVRQYAAEIESLDRQIAFKEGEERRLRADIEEFRRRIEAVPGLESEWIALTRDYDTQAASYRELLTKSSAAELALNLERQEIGERFRIVDAARVPVAPLPAVRARINGIGFALGLLLAIGLAALLEFRDASFRSDADVLEVLSLPVLASLPRIETESEKRRKRHRLVAVSAVGVACVGLAGYVVWALKLWNSLI